MPCVASITGTLICYFTLLVTLATRSLAEQSYVSTSTGTQRVALQSFYAALSGSAWVSNTGWITDAPTTHCTWEGVYCCQGSGCESANGITDCTTPCGVVGLSLANNNLVGNLEDADGLIWDALDTLEFLNLQGNAITGSVPASLASLPLLVGLSLQANLLTGTIPSEFFASSWLAEVVLAQNLFTGTIPDMSNMTDLVLFDLSQNRLQGTLPTAWASSTSLSYFAVQTNQLTGSIPVTDLANIYLEGLLEVNLRDNQLTGTLPVQLAALPLLRLDVGWNQFTGTFDKLLGSCSYIITLRAEQNMLSGSLPAEMASLGLEWVELHDNQLTGTIPESWYMQGVMRHLGLSNNLNLTGVIPDSFGNWSQLEALQLVHTGLRATTEKSNGQMLPSFLEFTEGAFSSVADVSYLQCPLVTANTSLLPHATEISVDPSYYSYQTCGCYNSHTLTNVSGTVTCVADLVDSHKSISITLLVVVPALVVFFILLDALGRLRRGSYDKLVLRWVRHKGAPGTGVEITLVSTDVEGSTELWEWDREVMDKAIDVHDHVIRTQLGKYNGYEVTTEGDAFLLAFHEASDAIAWSLATQQALLVAKWPTELQYHSKSCIRQLAHLLPDQAAAQAKPAPVTFQKHDLQSHLQDVPWEQAAGSEADENGIHTAHVALTIKSPADEAQFLELQEVAPKSVAFRGLAVRMGMATGKATQTSIHPLTRRTVYHGALVQLVETIVSVAHGGQVITDSATFTAMCPVLHEIAQRVPAQPNYATMTAHGRRQSMSSPSQSPILADRSQRRSPSRQMSMAGSAVVTGLMSQPSGMSVASQRGETFTQRLFSILPLISTTAQRMSFAVPKVQDVSVSKGQESRNLMVMDMGQHIVQDYAMPLTLHQMMVPGLEDRARTFPHLSTARQLSPGYFDAPATKQSVLGSPSGQGLKAELPLVTLVFSAVQALKAMRAQGDIAAEHALTLYKDVVRRLLRTTEGYECQEADGNFMLVFHRPMKAVQFCLLVQEEMMKVHWKEDVLNLPQCQAQVGRNQELIFVGPRVKMGIYEGIPTRVAPHTTTGSADYFGPLVNRAARFCNGAAHGGQVVGPAAIIPELLHAWGCEEVPDGRGPAQVIQVPSNAARLRPHDFGFPYSFGRHTDHTSQGSAQIRTSRSPGGSHKLVPQDLGTTSSTTIESHPVFGFSGGPQTPHAAVPSGVFPSPDGSPIPSPKPMTEIPLSAVGRINNPIYGDVADPQRLAASWVSYQHYGEAADQGKSAAAPAWQIVAPAPPRKGPLFLHRRSSTMLHHMKKPSWRSMSSKPTLAPALISELGAAGSANSLTALMTVDEAEEVDEAHIDSAAAMDMLSVHRPPMRRSMHIEPSQPELRTDLSADAIENAASALHSLQQQDRSTAVSVSSLVTASSVHGIDPFLEALSEVHISHIGEMKFKGVADPQSVVQFSTAHLAARQFSQEPPSAKAELVKVGEGLQYVVMMKDVSAVPPSRPLSVIV